MRKRRPYGWGVLLALMSALAPCASAAQADSRPEGRLWLKAAVHVHSTASTGTLSLESLAQRAERQGLDVLVLSDNFTLRYEYGVQPLERVVKYTVAYPALLEYGVERFLADVREVQERHPGLLIVPGVEVAPHYYWTGSLWAGDLTMHNAQRNLLVIGLTKPEDYAALPARGNPDSFTMDGAGFAATAPFLLLAPALWYWWPRRDDVCAAPGISALARWGRIVLIVAAWLSWGLYVWPVGSPAFSSYDPHSGYRPYQALIDAATSRGALVFWSMIDARDFSRHLVGPLGAVTIMTEPHPESLVMTHGYTGFGGLYQDRRPAVAPGGVWDQVVESRLQEQGAVLPTMVGEAAFHSLQDTEKDLDRVYTVVQAGDRTLEAVLEALRRGRAYAALRGDGRVLLKLDAFEVRTAGGRSAGMGGRLEINEGEDAAVCLSLSAEDGHAYPVVVRLIRSGRVIRRFEGTTPLVYEMVDREAPVGKWVSYRVDASAKSGQLLTNPVSVKRVRSDQ